MTAPVLGDTEPYLDYEWACPTELRWFGARQPLPDEQDRTWTQTGRTRLSKRDCVADEQARAAAALQAEAPR